MNIGLPIDLNGVTDKPPGHEYGTVYQARKLVNFGLSESNELITGLTLVVVRQGNRYDGLQENISNLGNEFTCVLPEEGLIEGFLYISEEVCTSTDWETGYCDDTELYIRRVL